MKKIVFSLLIFLSIQISATTISPNDSIHLTIIINKDNITILGNNSSLPSFLYEKVGDKYIYKNSSKGSVKLLDTTKTVLIKIRDRFSHKPDINKVVISRYYPASEDEIIIENSLKKMCYSIGFTSVVLASNNSNNKPSSQNTVDDMLKSLGYDPDSINLKKRKKVQPNTTVSKSEISGGRSRSNVMRVIRENVSDLKYLNARNSPQSGIVSGYMVAKWSIDQTGKVISCRILNSTMNNTKFKDQSLQKIKTWKFGKINKPGDITEVIYTFHF